ncbi:MAG: MBL fold metallo-hydrolase [Chitinophagales bacterium]|nr:MBL fold metallo-hydrolase [Chitinophagales bacterium]MDW8394101.1 MBL fold metallo-hydrolase [Chitinophagales bacterium]
MVIPLHEGTFTVDHSKQFIPFHRHTDHLEQRPPGSLLVDIVSFLVVAPGILAVVDPGLGTGTEEAWIRRAVRARGYDPEQVTHVLLSHLHKDHAGGAVWPDGQGWQLTFPAASYYVQNKEFAYAFSKSASRSYRFEALAFLYDHPQRVRFDGAARIGDWLEIEVSGGHTPHHQCFHFYLSNEHYFFGGDVAAQSGQLLRRFLAKYDADAARSQHLREQWAHRGAEQGWKFLFFHDAQKTIVTLRHRENRPELASFVPAEGPA